MLKDFYSPQKSSNHVWMKIFFLAFLFLLLLAFFYYLYADYKLKKPLTDFSRPEIFEVAKGETASEIGRHLEQERLIGSALVFRLYFSFHPDLRIQAGKFALDSNLTLREIIKKLSAGRGLSDEAKVTFLEGATLAEDAKRFEQAGLGSASEFSRAAQNFSGEQSFSFLSDKPKASTLEGYLFPDTYFFSKNGTAEDAIVRMLENFDGKLDKNVRAEISRQGKTIFEIIIMASMIEGEVGRNLKPGALISESDLERLKQERRLVASVFYNRLSINHALESDATVNYITGKKISSVSVSDTKLDNPYNTYRFRGLPPGPINSPSLDSVLAAVYPARTDYFYFLSKPSGEAVFARTLEEHNANKAKYLK